MQTQKARYVTPPKQIKSRGRSNKQRKAPNLQKRPLIMIRSHYVLLLALLSLTTTCLSVKGQLQQRQNETNSTVEQKKHIAVLHVGPHKTGTTAIQSVTDIFVDVFRKDSYIVLDYDRDFVRGTSHGRPTHNLAMCSCPKDSYDYTKCDEPLLEATHDKPPANMNLLLSHEAMDYACVDASKVRSVLEPKWDVNVVVAYRRFYEWIVSFYKQTHRTDIDNTAHGKKSHVWPKTHNNNDQVTDIRHWLTQGRVNTLYNTVYSTAVHQRYDAAFDNVSILNIHDVDNDLVGKFICDFVPNATNACHEWKSENIKPPDSNRAAVTLYDEIAVAAYFQQYISDKTSREEVRELIQHHQEEVLNLTAADFPKICTDDDIMDLILDLSMEAEQIMAPEFFDSEMGEEMLRSGFEMVKNTKFCSVDYDELWKQNDWVEFFHSIVERTSKGDDSINAQDELIHNDEAIYALAEKEEEKWNDEDEEMEGTKRYRHYLRH